MLKIRFGLSHIVVLTLTFLSNVVRPYLINVLETNSVMRKSNSDINKSINNIFTLLKLNTNFTKMSKVQALLTMHNDHINVAEKYYKIYEEIQDSLRVVNQLNKFGPIDKVINNINIKEYTHNDDSFKYISRDKNKINNSQDINEINDYILTEDNSTESFEIFKENALQDDYIIKSNFTNDTDEYLSAEFVHKFLSKLNKLSANDFTAKYSRPNLDLDLFNKSSEEFKTSIRSDLKVWVPPKATNDFHNNSLRRIYRGQRSNIKAYPFVVSVHFRGQFRCAGSIISKDLIITAASCLQTGHNNKSYHKKPKSLYIRAGSDFANKMGETIRIIEIYYHPSYNPNSLENNIAIGRMEKHLKFRNKDKRIRRIEYDKEANLLPDNTDRVSILGWGANTETGVVYPKQKLLVSELDVYNADECKSIYSRYYVNEKNFCAGLTSNGGGACTKDAGAPGVINGILTGVVSFGPPVCGTVGAPTVFTKLGYYADWIDEILNMEREVIRRKTTSNQPVLRLKPTVSKAVTPQTTATITDYPEEVSLLRKLIDDMLIANDTLIDYLLYGAITDGLNDFFGTTTMKVDIFNHPLINKSIIIPPEFFEHYKNEEEPTMVLTTWRRPAVNGTTLTLPFAFIPDTPADIDELEAALAKEYTTKTPHPTYATVTIETELSIEKQIPRLYGRTESPDASDSSNYEDNKLSSSYEGLSIDIEVTKLNRYANKNHNNDYNKVVNHITRPKTNSIWIFDSKIVVNDILDNNKVIKVPTKHQKQFKYETTPTIFKEKPIYVAKQRRDSH